MDCEGQVRKESAVDNALDQVAKRIKNLHTTACKFENMLSIALSPPAPTSETAACESGNSPLETRLLGFRESIGNINEILADILNRVQL